MKTFLVACGLLLVITALVVTNGVFVLKALDATIAAATLLPEDCLSEPPPATDTLTESWEKALRFAAITIPAGRLETLSRSVETVKAAAIARDDGLYRKARANLLVLLTEIRKMESFSLGSLF